VAAVDRRAAEAAIAEFLRALGRDPKLEPELAETPARVTEAFANELLRGYDVDLRALLAEGSSPVTGTPGVVAVRDLDVATTCPHHLMPGVGQATVVYRPGADLFGLGTLSRLVDACSRRLVLQEAIASSVVQALVSLGGARGAHCELTLVHGCLSARGACQPRARVTTFARAGELSDAEVLLSLGGGAGGSGSAGGSEA
jgi:GTP cyclohydrolase I